MYRAQATAAGPRRATMESVQVSGDLVPLSDYVLLKPKDAVVTTKGGIVLPGSVQEKPSEGKVLAVGPGSVDEESSRRLPPWTEVGMKVVYGKYGNEKVDYNGEEHVLVQDSEVLLSYTGDEPSLENLRMPRGKVLMRLLDEKTESEGGIILSKGAAKKDTTVGEVVAIGDPVLDPKSGEPLPVDLKVGDMVRFRYASEVKLEVGKAEYRAVDADDCVAKWSA